MELGGSLAVGVEPVLHPVLLVDLEWPTDYPGEVPTSLCLETLPWELDLALVFLKAGDLELLLNSRPAPWNIWVVDCSGLEDSL